MMRLSLLPVVFGVLLLATALRAAPPTNVVIHPDTPGGNTSAANSNTLSPSEWQELRAARMAALKANPAFVTKATQLNEKLREFEQKLNTAMMKTDPKIAPVLAKFAGNRPPAQPAGGPSNAPKPQ